VLARDHFGTKRALFYASHPGIDVPPEDVLVPDGFTKGL